jgi:hypothetical protein
MTPVAQCQWRIMDICIWQTTADVSGGLWTWVHVFSRRHQQCQWRIMDIDTCNWQTAPAIRVSVVNYGH